MFHMKDGFKVFSTAFLILATLLAISLTGCGSGTDGSDGTSSGTISGTVTNKTTGNPVAGVSVTTSPAVQGMTITTGSSGIYSATLPIGIYTVKFSRTDFADDTETITVVAGVTTTVDVALEPTSPVVVNVSADATTAVAAGGTVNLSAAIDLMDSSTVTGYAWSQTDGVSSSIATPSAASTGVTLGAASAYKTALVAGLVNLASLGNTSSSDLPKNPNTIYNGEAINDAGDVDTAEGLVINKTQVLGMSSDDRSKAAGTTYKLTVTTTSGTYSGTVKVAADISPYAAMATGLRNVPLNVPVLIHTKTNAGGYNWTLSAKPTGSTSTLTDATTQNPYFTPDLSGKYTLSESVSSKSLDIYAAEWLGAVGSDLTGVTGVTLSQDCTLCHKSTSVGNALKVFTDYFVPWSKSAKATILQRQIDNKVLGTSACTECHTLGYNSAAGAINNGFDDIAASLGFDYSSFISSGGEYDQLDPSLRALANVQCESCHGPSGALDGIGVAVGQSLHNNGILGDSGRVSLGAEICGSCHGEALSHARYQMWRRSAHSFAARQQDRAGIQANGNYPSMSCVRCHSGEGFLTWKKNYLDNGDSRQLRPTEVTWKAEDAHTQTCAVCHDPHDAGDTSSNAKVRISGDTPMLPAGFEATGVGRGAMCMVCHNSRNGWSSNDPDAAVQGRLGLHEDGDKVWDPAYQAYSSASGAPYNLTYGAPHQAAQTDVFMGRNAWFIGSNALRASHSYIKDTCVTCHMELTPAPSDLGVAGSTNHTFKSRHDICGNCHGSFSNADNLQSAVEAQLDQLKSQMGTYLLSKLPTTFYIASNKQRAKANIVGTPEPLESQGQQAFKLTFSNTSTATVTLGNFTKTNLYPASASSVANVSYDGTAKTITRAAGTWPAAFVAGGKITTNSVFNPGPFTIASITATVITVNENVNTQAASTRTVTQVVTQAQQDDKVIQLDDANGGLLVKVGWNYYLIEAGSAHGVHNPSFTTRVLDLSIKKLQ